MSEPKPILEWTYSRTQRRHTAYSRQGNVVFLIKSLAPYSEVQGKHGYSLQRPSGKVVRIDRRVKPLKETAEWLTARTK